MILSSHRNTCHRYHRGNQFRIVMVFKQELKKFKWGWGFMKPFLRDNLLMGRHESEERIWAVLANLKLDKIIQTLPNGLGTVLQSEASFLSRGQNQRLVLARCILQNKEIITLDEIETSMDKDSEKILLEILPSIASNAIVLLVTHRDSFDSLAKGMLNLDNQPSRTHPTYIIR